MLDQQQRHQYLEALGISSWLPRTPLPGAAPSADWVWDFSYPAPDIPFPATGASVSGVPAAAQPVADPAAARAALARSLGAFSEAPAKPESKKPDVVAAKSALNSETAAPAGAEVSASAVDEVAPAASSRPQPKFKLAFVRYGDLLVVDSLPTQSRQGFSDQHQRLVSAIVRSLPGDRTQQGAPFMLPWPMFASPTLSQGYDEALTTVQHKLDRMLEGQEVRSVLLMGDSAAQMCLERDETLDELRGILFTLRAGVKVIATHSLSEALQLPGIKKTIWLDLQPLIEQMSDA